MDLDFASELHTKCEVFKVYIWMAPLIPQIPGALLRSLNKSVRKQEKFLCIFVNNLLLIFKQKLNIRITIHPGYLSFLPPIMINYEQLGRLLSNSIKHEPLN